MMNESTQSWAERLKESFTGNYRPAPLAFTRGEGTYLYTHDGVRYLDFAAGIAVNSIGHNHPALTRALSDQARKLLHVSNLFINPPAVELAETLIEKSFAERVYFANSGAEANEAAFKMARRYMQVIRGEDRYEFICALQSFHGRTWAAISATGQEKYHQGFAPLVPGFKHVPYNDLTSIREALTPHTCAIMVEPLQGEGGIIEADPGYLAGLREICDEAGILLIFDEVQTGVGRTGNWFAHQYDGVAPDIMALAKGLGGGVPIGATLCTAEAGLGFVPGVHASTFGGNPLACRAGKTVIDVIESEGLVERAKNLGEGLATRFEQLISEHDVLIGHRGRGLLRGLITPKDFDRSQIVLAARAQGLLITTAGADALRVCPPLIIGEGHLDEAVEKLDKAIRSLG
jgi:acetylornithine/N-succinyldiaminopimelate aminotransferase